MMPSDITKHRHGWLRPDGKFFACSREGHLLLLDDLGIHWKEAEERGWTKLATTLAGKSSFYRDFSRPATQATINAMDKHCAAFGVELPWWAGGEGA